ncbi:NAD-dependent epimerase/dehydratase family protein [Amycolatopsis kentuckyensis]|uniref:NAD-dependent epimerase/dehydratase family protein n=1 Tax=Amycolatopsis kentuckyensis TaxID=218823 RepID=UPI003564D776
MRTGEPDLLVTGATGFVGTAVLRELVARGEGARVRVLARRPVPGWMTDAGVTTWRGDVTDAAGLVGLCTGITTLVHLASQVGGDAALCTAVNEDGTAKLLAEARRAGTADVLYLSTCAVYRDGVHRGSPVPGGPGAGSGPGTDPAASAGRGRRGGESGPGSPAGRGGFGSTPGMDPGASGGPGTAPAAQLGSPAGHGELGGDSGPVPQIGRASRTGHDHPAGGSALVTGPVSATSRSRLAGERLVLAAGGVVLRPHLIHGDGDRHVVPALARWISAVPAWAAGGAARTSLVAVADLAAAIAVLALNPGTGGAGEVFHVADPDPVRLRGLITAVCALLDLPVPVADLTLTEHRARTRAALPALTDHQYSLLTRDHWYESTRIWELTGVSPGPGFGPRLAEAAEWYRGSLGAAR